MPGAVLTCGLTLYWVGSQSLRLPSTYPAPGSPARAEHDAQPAVWWGPRWERGVWVAVPPPTAHRAWGGQGGVSFQVEAFVLLRKAQRPAETVRLGRLKFHLRFHFLQIPPDCPPTRPQRCLLPSPHSIYGDMIECQPSPYCLDHCLRLAALWAGAVPTESQGP